MTNKNNLKNFNEEFLEDLLIAGHEVMERNPDVGFDEWVNILMRQYPAEIVDALGTKPDKILYSLKEIWKSHFRGSVIV